MIPESHVLFLALIQFSIGLLGLLLRRAAMVVLVSAIIMLNGVLIAFSAAISRGDTGPQAAGLVFLVVLVAVSLSGGAVLYAIDRFRKTVSVEEHDQMRH